MLFRVTFRPNSCSHASGSMSALPKPKESAKVAFPVEITIRAAAVFERTDSGGSAMPRNCLTQAGSISDNFLMCRTAFKASGIFSTEVSISVLHLELRYLSLVEKSLFSWKTVHTRNVCFGFLADRLVTIRTSFTRVRVSLPDRQDPGTKALGRMEI